MATPQELEDRLEQIQQQLGLPSGTFNVNGEGINPGSTVRVSVASWPWDYSVHADKLLELLDPKTLILMALRLGQQ